MEGPWRTRAESTYFGGASSCQEGMCMTPVTTQPSNSLKAALGAVQSLGKSPCPQSPVQQVPFTSQMRDWITGMHRDVVGKIYDLQMAQMEHLELLVGRPVNALRSQQEKFAIELHQQRDMLTQELRQQRDIFVQELRRLSTTDLQKSDHPCEMGNKTIASIDPVKPIGHLQAGPVVLGDSPVTDEEVDAVHREKSLHVQVGEDAEVDMLVMQIQLEEKASFGDVMGRSQKDLSKPSYDVQNFYWETGVFQRLARSSAFEKLSHVMICLNAVYIGIEADHGEVNSIYDADLFYQLCTQVFCFFFTLELFIRFMAFKIKRDCLTDGWIRLDLLLVSTMIVDIWIIHVVIKHSGDGTRLQTQPLRILRLLKLTRMARLMRAFPELVMMIKGLTRSLRAVSSSLLLITLMIYVWGIVMHMLLQNEHEFNDRLWRKYQLGFQSVRLCMWTLFVNGTLMLDNTGPIMTELVWSSEIRFRTAGILFILYGVLTSLLILQSLIGVLCDVVSQVRAEERDAMAIGLVKQELLGDLLKFDGGDGGISQQELYTVMNNPNTKALMKKLHIDPIFLFEIQKTLFTSHTAQIPITECLELMIMCQGTNSTTVEAMGRGLLAVIREITLVKRMLASSYDVRVLHQEGSPQFSPQVSPRG